MVEFFYPEYGQLVSVHEELTEYLGEKLPAPDSNDFERFIPAHKSLVAGWHQRGFTLADWEALTLRFLEQQDPPGQKVGAVSFVWMGRQLGKEENSNLTKWYGRGMLVVVDKLRDHFSIPEELMQGVRDAFTEEELRGARAQVDGATVYRRWRMARTEKPLEDWIAEKHSTRV